MNKGPGCPRSRFPGQSAFHISPGTGCHWRAPRYVLPHHARPGQRSDHRHGASGPRPGHTAHTRRLHWSPRRSERQDPFVAPAHRQGTGTEKPGDWGSIPSPRAGALLCTHLGLAATAGHTWASPQASTGGKEDTEGPTKTNTFPVSTLAPRKPWRCCGPSG